MSALFTGALVEEIDPVEKWSSRTGLVITRRWKGMPEQIEIYKSQARSLGYEYATDWEYPYKVLSVDFPEDSEQPNTVPLSDDWECLPSLIEKDIWLLPKVQAELNKFGILDDSSESMAMALFKSDVEKLVAGEPFTNTPTFGADGSISWTETPLSIKYIKDTLLNTVPSIKWDVIAGLITALVKGVRTKPIPTSTLVRTLVTNNNSQIIATQNNVGAIFSTESLIAIEQIQTNKLKFQIPIGYWLKNPPIATKIEKGRWEIKQEYLFGEDYDRFTFDTEATG